MKRKTITVLMIALMLLTGLPFDNMGVLPVRIQTVEADDVSSEIVLRQGKALKMSDRISVPENTVWKSSNNKVAQVLSNHLIGISAGKTVLTATVDGNDYSLSVRVDNGYEACELNSREVTLYPGETFDLVAAGISDAIWSSDDDSIASVDGNGRIKGKAVGTTKIHMTSAACGQKSDCVVEVVENDGAFIEKLDKYGFDYTREAIVEEHDKFFLLIDAGVYVSDAFLPEVERV